MEFRSKLKNTDWTTFETLISVPDIFPLISIVQGSDVRHGHSGDNTAYVMEVGNKLDLQLAS